MLYSECPTQQSSMTPATEVQPATPAVPLEDYARRVRARSFGARLLPSLKYLFTTEVHVFSFAIAANVLLSFIPFVVLLLALCRNVLHWPAATDAILALLRDALPSNQDFIASRLQVLARSHKTQIFSLALLLFTSTGALLPLEVALNRVWRIPRDRSFLRNQVVSFALAFGCGVLALLSVLLTAVNLSAITASFGRLGWGRIVSVVSFLVMKLTALPTTILIFFLLYYVMPNGKVPARPVLRAAVFAGLLTEVVKYVYIWTLPWLNFREVYGPFSVSVTLLMWAFLSSLVLLVGAHLSAPVDPAANKIAAL